MIEDQARQPSKPPHPVAFDVEYPERLLRWLVLVKWLLAIPHLIIVYLLSLVVGLLSIVAWFAILFTGKYPRSMHGFVVGVLRWSANVNAYILLQRDEYPPFSFDAGQYAVTLDIPYPERQSRWRLFIRWFALVPNQIVLFFVQIAWWVTLFIAWWAILFTGRYPRGLFNFSVGVQRWAQRSVAYSSYLRDEYPPYSTRADARPGNEVVSAIIGFPLIVGLIVLYVTVFVLLVVGGGKTVTVSSALLNEPGGIERTMPSADAGRVTITLEGFGTGATLAGEAGTFVYFDVKYEKDGFGPTFYSSVFFFLDNCTEENIKATDVEGDVVRLFWIDGTVRSRVYFPEQSAICSLDYFNGLGFIRFKFE